jgi:hypothetical protein
VIAGWSDSEAARVLWHKEEQAVHRGKNKGIKIKSEKYTLHHIARFILVGLYTGMRAAAIAAASPRRKESRSYVALDPGHRKARHEQAAAPCGPA